MKSSSLVNRSTLLSANHLSTGLLRRGVLRQLRSLRHGQLLLVEDGEQQLFGTPGTGLLGEIHIQDPATWGLVAGNGSIGAGEAFIHGYWTSPGRRPGSPRPALRPGLALAQSQYPQRLAQKHRGSL